MEALVRKNVKFFLDKGFTRYLLAVSGGIDSIVLLDVITKIAEQYAGSDIGLPRIEIGIAHIDHSLREESERDAELVSEVASMKGLPFYWQKLHPTQGAFRSAGGIEAWGRNERYAFLEQIRVQQQFDLIMTAHHKLDVVETFLFKAISNRRLRSLRFWDESRLIARPLFNIDKENIRKYAEQHRLTHHEDISNSNICFTRNRIRMTMVKVIPEVESGGINNLFNTAVSTDEDYSRIEKFIGRLVSEKPFGSREWIREIKQDLARYPEFDWWLIEANLFGVVGYQLGKKHALRFVQFLVTSQTSNLEIPGWVFRKKDGEIYSRRSSACKTA